MVDKKVDLSGVSNLDLLEDKLSSEQALKNIEDALKRAGIAQPDEAVVASMDFLKERIAVFEQEIQRRVRSAG